MEQKPIILVTGATGGQGGSVAHHLLKTKKYHVRALTRNPDSEKAMKLKKLGAEIVKGDLAERDSLQRAVEGCYGVFGVTNFWEHFNKEYDHGINLIEAVKNSTVQHFVLHTLPSAVKLSHGKLPVPHMDIKAELEEYTRDHQIPATFVHVSFYYENFLTFFPPQPAEDGNWHIALPQGDTKLAGVSVEDIGSVVSEIFKAPEEFKGKAVGIVGEDITLKQYVAVMTEILKRPYVYDYVPYQTYATFPFPGASELANMFEFNRVYISDRKADLDLTKKLSPAVRSFSEWLRDNKHHFHNLAECQQATV
jgi:uncharacterized protein YbjT (DUF2867 family)